MISTQIIKMKQHAKQERTLSDVLLVLLTLIKSLKEEQNQIHKGISTYLEQLKEFNLHQLLELAFATDNKPLLLKGIQFYGEILVIDEAYAIDLYKAYPHIHRLVVQNIIVGQNITPNLLEMTRSQQADLEDRRKLVRIALWSLSNLAAMYQQIDYYESSNGHEDECMLVDGTIEQVINTIFTALKFHYKELFFEGMFFLTVLAT